METIQPMKTIKTILGIDPGKLGGIAVIRNFEELVVSAFKMPPTERDLWDMLSEMIGLKFAYIENVHAFPGQRVSSTFSFGK